MACPESGFSVTGVAYVKANLPTGILLARNVCRDCLD
jgi:hypothetical protein